MLLIANQCETWRCFNLRNETNILSNREAWVKPWSQGWLIAAGAYLGFCSMKRLEVFLLPLDRMLVHCRSPNNSPVPIYTPEWREALWEFSVLPKNTTQCPRPGLEPGPLAPESSALTRRPPSLPLLSRAFGISAILRSENTCQTQKVDVGEQDMQNLVLKLSCQTRKKYHSRIGNK